jgi:glyoxylase-like metal-dependent hydrolase (beta-lactamase superfamily II)
MSHEMTPALIETAGGAKIHRLPLEVFPKFWAYVYVLQDADFCVLIDTGSGTDDSHQHLLDGLSKAGFSPNDLTHIILTHAHIDHYGGLSRLRPITGAKIGVHGLDLQTVAHHEARLALIGRRLASFLAETGLADDRREQLLGIYRITKAIYQSVPVDFTYEEDGMQPGPLEFIHLPGHCPGHVAIRLDEVVFCGDMVVQGVTPHLSPASINPYSGLDHYLDSLARLQLWAGEARIVLNGHDDVITDLPVQIESTRKNILRRMRRAVVALAEPLTIDQTCKAVYGETDGYNLLLVIEKTGAYVEYLYEHGMLEITNPEEVERGEPACYRRLGDQGKVWAELDRKVNTYAGTHIQR